MTPTIHTNIPYATYAAMEGVNWSTLSALRESPLHYRHALARDRKPTPSMLVGTAVHLAVLEPHRWDTDVAIWEDGRRGTSAHKAWLEQHEGKLQLNRAEADEVLAIAAAARSHPAAVPLLAEGVAEVVIQWVDEESAIPCKARLDWLSVHDDRAILVDLKTARTLSRRDFTSHVAGYGYHCQLAHYAAAVAAATGLPVETYILGVESSAPYDAGVFLLDEGVPDGALHVGGVVRRKLLTELAERRALDEWPGRYPDVEPLVLPGWALVGDEADEFTFGETDTETGEGAE